MVRYTGKYRTAGVVSLIKHTSDRPTHWDAGERERARKVRPGRLRWAGAGRDATPGPRSASNQDESSSRANLGGMEHGIPQLGRGCSVPLGSRLSVRKQDWPSWGVINSIHTGQGVSVSVSITPYIAFANRTVSYDEPRIGNRDGPNRGDETFHANGQHVRSRSRSSSSSPSSSSSSSPRHQAG
jgi:hypothetical protein